MFKKIFHLIISTSVLVLNIPVAWAQTPLLSERRVTSGPVSLEPAIEKDGVRVALQTSIQKKDELMVLIKISNLSTQPILVSPDAVEASTAEGCVIKPAGTSGAAQGKWDNSPAKKSSWAKFTDAAAFIPFSDPYHIISSTKAIAQYAEKNNIRFFKPAQKTNRGFLREVILQPGMATHGLIIYDASSLRAFDYAPTLHIKVTVGEEPFEFQFSSRVASPPSS